MLDTDLIRTRRRQLGLSDRAVGRAVGATGLTIGRLEDSTNTDELTLRTLSRLAEVLGVTPARLLTETSSAEARSSRQAGNDTTRLGALLAAADRPVATSTLADALDITLDEVETLLAVYADQLEEAGMALQRAEDGVSIVSTLVDDDTLQLLLRAQHAAHGLSATDAKLLARALAGTLNTGVLGNNDRVALARLQNAGVLDDTAVSDDVLLGLRP